MDSLERGKLRCSPGQRLLRATLDRLVELKILEDPGKEGYDVDWPPLDSPSTEDRAETAEKFAKAIAAAAPDGAGDLIMPPWEFREKILGLDPVPPPMPDGFLLASGFDLGDGDEGDGGGGLALEEAEE